MTLLESENDYSRFYRKIKQNWDSIAKPLDSLGRLETLLCRAGAIQKSESPDFFRALVLVLCSDNGVVEEGISQSPQEVTRICAENIGSGITTVGIMARQYGAKIKAIDLGINCSESLKNVEDRKIRKGTRNFAREPAMTEKELERAIETGLELVKESREKGFSVICIGEMGIGNTTTSSALACALLKADAASVTGRGAGLSDEGLKKKVKVIEEAVSKYELKSRDVKTVLQTVGGYDIAAMAGVFLGAKKYGVPVILDGAISLVAALCAQKLDPSVTDFLIPGHKGREPLVGQVCSELGLEPVLDADMALGEGTGAVLVLGLLQTAAAVYSQSVSFAKSGVEQYERFGTEKKWLN